MERGGHEASTPWGALPVGRGTERAMDWPEIYRRLRCDRNDPDAWEALEYRVRGWARGALWQRGWHVVEEAVVDTCAEVAVRCEKARGPDTFSGFAYGQFLNVRQRLLHRLREPVVPIGDSPPTLILEEGPTAEERDLLRQCLRTLPVRARRAVALRYFEDASDEVIATALGVTKGNARQIVFTAMAALRRCVRERWNCG